MKSLLKSGNVYSGLGVGEVVGVGVGAIGMDELLPEPESPPPQAAKANTLATSTKLKTRKETPYFDRAQVMGSERCMQASAAAASDNGWGYAVKPGHLPIGRSSDEDM